MKALLVAIAALGLAGCGSAASVAVATTASSSAAVTSTTTIATTTTTPAAASAVANCTYAIAEGGYTYFATFHPTGMTCQQLDAKVMATTMGKAMTATSLTIPMKSWPIACNGATASGVPITVLDEGQNIGVSACHNNGW